MSIKVGLVLISSVIKKRRKRVLNKRENKTVRGYDRTTIRKEFVG